MIFTTRGEQGEAVCVVTALDRERHEAEYHRSEPGRYVARVRVRCRAVGGARTEARVAYGFIGVSETGNREIAAMSDAAFADKMKRWQGWIEGSLAGGHSG